jgi:adenine-specific DNA-methyltransferase
LSHIDFWRSEKVEDKKRKGSFYTPKVIADFLVDHLSKKLNGLDFNILEPSAGDGIFVKSIYEHPLFANNIKKFVAIEREKSEIGKILKIPNSINLKPVHADFLEYQNLNKSQFDLVIGNPPYIRKRVLEADQIIYCEDIHTGFPELSKNKIKNIWTAFLVRAIKFVNEQGILAFVLPSEFLQVKFAAELRTLVLNEFERVEIFTFNELLFKDCKGQDTIILIGERKAEKKGVFYCNIDKAADLPKQEFKLAQNLNIRESKWTHHHITTDEIELLQKLKKEVKIIKEYCYAKAGIVTAANNYFIVNQEIVQKYNLSEYVKKIIQKGSFVNGSAVLGCDEFELLINQSKPAFLLALNNQSVIQSNDQLAKYFEKGIALEINKRYKSTLRKNWYEVPNVGVPAAAFFFKRCNEYPKIIKNEAQVLTTDCAYTINMKEGFDANSLIFSFYNSLTLSFAELNGRYYGGGVLELTPNEFKNLPVPYLQISPDKFTTFVQDFKDKSTISDICRKNDYKILKAIDPKIDVDALNKLMKIREKLFNRRMKTN